MNQTVIHIYRVEKEKDANLKVYLTFNKEDVNWIEGIWYFPKNKKEEKKMPIIATFVFNQEEADVNVFPVYSREEAGWVSQEKRVVLENILKSEKP